MRPAKRARKVAELSQISGNIAYFLKIHEMSQTALAERIQCDRRTLYKKMQNPGKFSVAELSRISKVFGVPLVEILKGEPRK